MSCIIPIKAGSKLFRNVIVYAEEAFYVIGGAASSESEFKNIGRLDGTTFVWTKAGELVTSGRYAHNAIFIESSILVVGGHGRFKTEKCTISNKKVICVTQEPELDYYSHYPEIFLVEDDFCKTLP